MMQAGKELDALIAERVMGWEPWVSPCVPNGGTTPDCWSTGDDQSPSMLMNGWSPSTDIADAWLVVERMNSCLHLREHGTEGVWEASFCHYPNSTAHGETAPLAICLAALEAVKMEANR